MQPSRSIRIFLSSTFRDFGEERDLLVRLVFPSLRTRLKDRFIELVDVDLRWGITVEQAERGEVLPICLGEIDRARPYFIGMLGERYGWIPPEDGYAPDLLERQPWLKTHQGGKSVTELEILHGVLNNSRMKGRAFFYFRSSLYSKRKGGDYVATSAEDQKRQNDLKLRIKAKGFPVTQYPNPQALAKRMEQDLWKLLDAEFPASSVPDAFDRESLRHQAYAAPLMRLYLDRERYQKIFNEALLSGEQRVVIEGASGGGKSALLSHVLLGHRRSQPKDVVYAHYLGASADSADPHALVKRLIEHIKRTTANSNELEDDPQKIMDSFPKWLAHASAWAVKRKVRWVFALDGLDRLSRLADLRWFPDFVPPRVHWVITCLGGATLSALLSKTTDRKWTRLEVKPLNIKERETLLVSYLARYNKTLSKDLIAKVLKHPLSNNPLFTKTLAEELRLFGVHEELQSKLSHYLSSQSIDDLFERVLQRVEIDCGQVAVQQSMSSIWASRAGLTEKEILGICMLKPATWAPIRNALDEALIEVNGRITFAHDYLKVAVQDRYLATKVLINSSHLSLSKWFKQNASESRRAEEEAWQLRAAEDWPALLRCLSDHQSMMSMYEHRGTFEVAEYWLAIEAATSKRMEHVLSQRWRIWCRGLAPQKQRTTSDVLVDVLHYSGRITKFTLRLAQKGLELARQDRSVNRPGLIPYINMLAVLHKDCGQYALAEPLYLEALQLSLKLKPKYRESLATRMNNLAVFYRHTGRLHEAEGLYRKSLDISTQDSGQNSESVGISLSNLVPVLRLTGRLSEALACSDRAISILRRIHGNDDPGLIMALNNKGQVLKSLQRETQAQAVFTEALHLGQKLLGPRHLDIALILNNLGDLLSEKDAVLASRYASESLQIRQTILSEHHPDIASCLEVLGACAREERDDAKAHQFISQAAAIYAAAGLKSDEASTLNRLGLIAHDAGEFDTAAQQYQSALDKLDQVGQKESQKAITISNNMAMLLKEMGDLEGALKVSQKSLKLRQKLYPERIDKLAASLHNIASILEEMGEQSKALRLYKQSLVMQERASGKVHEELLDTLINLGTLLASGGRLMDGMQYLQRALKIAETRLGTNHSRTGLILYHLGGVMGELGDVKAAALVLKREIGIAEIHEGAESDSVRLSLRGLGVLLRNHGMLQDANECLTRSLKIATKLHGKNSAEVATELSALGQLRFKQKLWKEAREFLAESLRIRKDDPNSDPEDISTVEQRLIAVEQEARDE